jgi:hypothetical protein
VLQGDASSNPIWDVLARALGAIPAGTTKAEGPGGNPLSRN